MTSLLEEIIQLLRDSASAGTLPAHLAQMPLNAQTTVADLGVDSLGKMTLLTSLMDLTDRYLADDAIQDHHTLADIVALLAD